MHASLETGCLAHFKNSIFYISFNLQYLPFSLSFPFISSVEESSRLDWSISHGLDFAWCSLMGQFNTLCCPRDLLLILTWIRSLIRLSFYFSGKTLGGHLMSGCLSCGVCSSEVSALRSSNSLGVQNGDIYCFLCAVIHILLLINFVIPYNL